MRLAMLGRHQAASFLATLVDFTTMIALVEWCGAAVVLATIIGATLGSVFNFLMNRRWTFRATGHLARQGVRYALVSGGSAFWNAAGEYVGVHLFGVRYVLARLVVSFFVSVCWNYPLQRWYVFGAWPRGHVT